jgi:hypothetical protein
MTLKDKILNRYSSWILGIGISASCFYGAYTLDNSLVDEKKIYNVVPEKIADFVYESLESVRKRKKELSDLVKGVNFRELEAKK